MPSFGIMNKSNVVKLVMKRFSSILVAGIAVMATQAQADIFRPSVQDQIKLGKDAAANIRKEAKMVPASDPRAKEFEKLGKALVAVIPEKEMQDKKWEFSFEVVEDETLNAFALPGGPIFINTGLLNKLKTQDEVVGVLSHEIIHVRNQHWASAYADNLKRQLGIVVILQLLSAGQTAYDLAGIADTVFWTLPYSRRHESEADIKGYDMMVQAKFNPEGMARTFEVLSAGNNGKKPDEFLSTHPDTDKRC
ncbi:MAG: M48 family metalloprotease [Fimbriimonadaceae bacterium]